MMMPIDMQARLTPMRAAELGDLDLVVEEEDRKSRLWNEAVAAKQEETPF